MSTEPVPTTSVPSGLAYYFDLIEAPDLTYCNSTSRPKVVLQWAEENIRFATAHYFINNVNGIIHNVFDDVDDLFAAEFWTVISKQWEGFDRVDQEGFSRVFTTLRQTHSIEYYSEEDRAFFDRLPEVIRVYRGGDATTVLTGISYTLDWECAESFARGHRNIRNEIPAIISGTVSKKDIAFATNSRSEKEIVVFSPECVTDKRVEQVAVKRTKAADPSALTLEVKA